MRWGEIIIPFQLRIDSSTHIVTEDGLKSQQLNAQIVQILS